jgi:hypothetical protein
MRTKIIAACVLGARVLMTPLSFSGDSASAVQVTQSGQKTVIAVSGGPDADLWVYRQRIGTTKWQKDEVPGATYTDHSSAIAEVRKSTAQAGDSTVIAAVTSNPAEPNTAT